MVAEARVAVPPAPRRVLTVIFRVEPELAIEVSAILTIGSTSVAGLVVTCGVSSDVIFVSAILLYV